MKINMSANLCVIYSLVENNIILKISIDIIALYHM